MATNTQRITELESHRDAVDQIFAQSADNLGQLQKRIGDHEKGLQRGSIERRTLEVRSDRFAQRLGEVHRDLTLVKKRIDALGDFASTDHIQALLKELGRLQSMTEAFNTDVNLQLEHLTADVRELQKDHGKTKLIVSNHGERIESVEVISAQNSSRIETIERSQETVPNWTYLMAIVIGVIGGIIWWNIDFRQSLPGQSVPLVYEYADSGLAAVLFGIAVAALAWFFLSFFGSSKGNVTKSETSNTVAVNHSEVSQETQHVEVTHPVPPLESVDLLPVFDQDAIGQEDGTQIYGSGQLEEVNAKA